MGDNPEHQNPSHLDSEPEKGKFQEIGEKIEILFQSLLNFDPHERAVKDSMKIIKSLFFIEMKMTVEAMRLFLADGNNLGDSFISKTRKRVTGLTRNLSQYPLFRNLDDQKVADVQRWIFAKYVEGLYKIARSNSHPDASIRGIAWSLLAKDAMRVLRESGQIIDNQWLFNTVAPILRSKGNLQYLSQELSRFIQGDPEIISSHTNEKG